MSWDEWKQQRAHYLKKNARIAELEHAYSVLKRTLTETVIERDGLKAENPRLREALPPPDRLRLLADWFDCNHFSPDTEVQDDLRKWAEAIEQALERET